MIGDITEVEIDKLNQRLLISSKTSKRILFCTLHPSPSARPLENPARSLFWISVTSTPRVLYWLTSSSAIAQRVVLRISSLVGHDSSAMHPQTDWALSVADDGSETWGACDSSGSGVFLGSIPRYDCFDGSPAEQLSICCPGEQGETHPPF